MKQKINCHKGKCAEYGTVDSEIEYLKKQTNIVEKIQTDLLQENMTTTKKRKRSNYN
ncbi:hypothetical protein HN587_02905 [Candidatus Woesearchaeota archaeon]|jgi:hypothetical protein|nr:hypothetical protein [Candidatus Woesearchaeota archaeon]